MSDASIKLILVLEPPAEEGWCSRLGCPPYLTLFWFIFIGTVSVTSIMPYGIVYTGTVEVIFIMSIVGRAISDLKSVVKINTELSGKICTNPLF